MDNISLKINGTDITVPAGTTVKEAAEQAGIYIPVLCSHPDIKPFHSVELTDFIYQGKNKIYNDRDADLNNVRGCGVCLVYNETSSALIPSCKATAESGMVITTENELVKSKRNENMSKILATHPHSCLTCGQREGCIPSSGACSSSVDALERCCALFNICEIQKVAEYIGIAPETPRYINKILPIVTNNPLFNIDYNLCISCGRCVRVCQQVKGVYALGAVINEGVFKVGTVNGPTLSEAECRFCGSCVEVCPTGSLMDKGKYRLKDLTDYVPCMAACPGEVDIPQYVRLVSQGKPQEAAEVIASRLPLPSVLGKVCFHPCEESCKRNEVSETLKDNKEPLNIRLIKDYAMSNSTLQEHTPPNVKTGKKVAVIGAGPSGLTAGYFLALKGHSVVIFEKESHAGGMTRYGIPRYRLPLDIVEKDISRILTSGVSLVTNTEFGKDITIETLREKEFDAIYIATGLSKSRTLSAYDTDNDSILYGINFLNSLAKDSLSNEYFESESVIVIGGGNVATDVARAAVRLKASEVKIVCLEQYDEMPAYKVEIKESEEEGIKILNGWGINSIFNNSNQLEINFKKCTRVFNNQGNFSPEFDETSQNKLSCNKIIFCIGQEADKEFAEDKFVASLMERGLVKVNSETLITNSSGVFAGGDIVSGPASVIDAIGYGRKAARSIELFLGGDGNINNDEGLDKNYNMHIGRKEGFSTIDRFKANILNPEIRKNNFEAVEGTLSEAQALLESARCLQCDLRQKIRHNSMPPEKYLKFVPDMIMSVPSEEGVLQLLDDKKEVFFIKGSDDMRKTALDLFNDGKNALYFIYEPEPMFTKRESELIQQYLQKHGKMPDAGDELDDLF